MSLVLPHEALRGGLQALQRHAHALLLRGADAKRVHICRFRQQRARLRRGWGATPLKCGRPAVLRAKVGRQLLREYLPKRRLLRR